MRDQEGIRSTFTTIYHDKRIELGLNCLEYVLLDTVFILSQNHKGYCYKSIRSLARDLGMSFDGIRKAIIRLSQRELLIYYKDGYKTSDLFIQTVHIKTDRPAVTNRSTDRSAVRTDRSAVTTDRFVASQQMLDIHKNNNRSTHGTPRLNSRVPKPIKPLSETAKRLQARVEAIRRDNSKQESKAA